MAGGRWYRDFFELDFWRLVEHEYRDELVAEVAALELALRGDEPRRRVLDVACGVGTRALSALAQAGFDVLGLEPSRAALDEAARRGERAGVHVRWELVDPFAERSWPAAPTDAALCLDCLGWGSDFEQRRVFRRLRRRLPEDGLLIVRTSSFWLKQLETEIDGVRYHLEAGFDAATSRATGMLHVAAKGTQERRLPFDVRVYSPVELATLLREAGFHVDGKPDAAATLLFLRARAAPPRALAVAAWRTPPGVRLDLRYAPDEAELLRPRPVEIWESLVLSAPYGGGEIVGGYAVDDPSGGERGVVVVGGYFGCPAAAQQVTFGAGVTGLLHDLCGLADGGQIAAPELVHSDLEAWGAARGNELCLLHEPATGVTLVDEIDAYRPALVHLDRPTFTGDLLGLDELERIVAAAAACDAAVVIDESALPYLGGAASAATLVPGADNLVVLRGFTKAYSLGGLRAGFAFASVGIAERVRELVAPLQVGELALQAALRLLGSGDIFERLRARVHAVKPDAVKLLEAAGLRVFAGHPALPWVAVSDPAARRRVCSTRTASVPCVPCRPPAQRRRRRRSSA